MRGYKLFRKMRDGYAPLFINKRQRLHPGVTYPHGDHRTKGFAHRPGWHVCSERRAPHLTERGRVWCEVEFTPMARIDRPDSQGGVWFLGSDIRIIREV